VVDASTSQEVFQIPQKARTYVSGVAFSPDSERIAAAFLEERKVEVSELRTGNTVLTIPGGRCVSFSPDGQFIATGGPTARICDASSGAVLKTLETSPHDQVRSVSFSPDSKTLITLSEGRSSAVQLWDVTSGQKLLELPNEQSCTFSLDGTQLITARIAECTLRDRWTGQAIRTFNLRGWGTTDPQCRRFARIGSGPGWGILVRIAAVLGPLGSVLLFAGILPVVIGLVILRRAKHGPIGFGIALVGLAFLGILLGGLAGVLTCLVVPAQGGIHGGALGDVVTRSFFGAILGLVIAVGLGWCALKRHTAR
jgi:hypothetical protein